MNKLESFIAGLPCGFITEKQLPELIALDRLHPVLVRCGGGRFTCGAQDVEHFLKCVAAGGDYVRDVSLPVGSAERARAWVEEESVAKCVHRAANTRAAGLLEAGYQNERPAKQARGAWRLMATGPEFDENDCSGVYDGHQVTSDADPGL